MKIVATLIATLAFAAQAASAPLHLAAEKGDIRVIAMLLNANTDPDAKDEWGKTPLHLAAGNGHAAAIAALVNAGADLNVKDSFGHAPLYWAAKDDDIKTIVALLAAGADPFTHFSGEARPLQAIAEGVIALANEGTWGRGASAGWAPDPK